ncbi:MAG: hypothetical protein ACLVBJ_01245 [Pilosibacter sp.]
MRHVWIRWEERENFASSTETDCHYMLDKNEGILQFSDGSMEGSRMTAVKLPSGSDTGAEVENAEMCRREQ